MTRGKSWVNWRSGLLVLAVSIITFVWAILPIWLNGIRGGYDSNFHMGRIMALADGIRAGHFPNPIGYRYLQGMGYGVGFFYGNFWLYPAAFFVVQGAAVGQVYTVLLCVLVAGAMLSIGLTTVIMTKNLGAAAVAIPAYVPNYYNVSVLFGRAAINEAMALIWMPLVVLGAYAVWQGWRYDWWLLGGSMAAMPVSHLLSLVIAMIFLLLLVLVSLPRLVKRPRMIGHWRLGGIFGAGLGAAFLLPLAEQFMVQTYKNTALDGAGRPLILGSPINIVSAITPWIAQVQGATGSFLLLAEAAAVISAIVGWPSRPSGFIWTLIIVAVPIGLLVYSPAFVAAIYHVNSGIAVFQASWRCNTVLIPLLTVIIADWTARVGQRWLPLGLIVLNLLVYYPAFQNTLYFVHTRTASAQWVAYSISMGEYLPAAFSTHYAPWTTPADILQEEPGITLKSVDADHMIVIADQAWSGREVTVPKIYYAGYHYAVDQNGSHRSAGVVRKGEKGLGVARLPAYSGTATVVITYRSTAAAKAGFLISGLTAVIGGAVPLLSVYRKHRRR